MAEHIEYVSTLWQPNINKKQQKIRRIVSNKPRLHVLVMNVEALQKNKTFATKFLLSHKTLMAIDEIATAKNPKAKRTKAYYHCLDVQVIEE